MDTELISLYKPDTSKPQQYHSSHGTLFVMRRADLDGGVIVYRDEREDRTRESQFLCDTVEFARWHIEYIRPELSYFRGYDCTRYEIRKVDFLKLMDLREQASSGDAGLLALLE